MLVPSQPFQLQTAVSAKSGDLFKHFEFFLKGCLCRGLRIQTCILFNILEDTALLWLNIDIE